MMDDENLQNNLNDLHESVQAKQCLSDEIQPFEVAFLIPRDAQYKSALDRALMKVLEGDLLKPYRNKSSVKLCKETKYDMDPERLKTISLSKWNGPFCALAIGLTLCCIEFILELMLSSIS